MLVGHADNGSSSAEPLEVDFFDELRQRQLPWLLLVIVNFAQFRGIHSQLAGHLHLDVRQVVAFSRILPRFHLLLFIHGFVSRSGQRLCQRRHRQVYTTILPYLYGETADLWNIRDRLFANFTFFRPGVLCTRQ